MAVTASPGVSVRYSELEKQFPYWEKIGDCIDQFIDVFENYRQSGHPGGSRSKRHMLVALTLGGFMRWDIRHPEKRFGDRFILVAGHTVPLIYSMLAVYNTALHAKYARTGDPRYPVPEADERQLMWRDLLGFRRHGGLAGHAEMEGKTLFLKFNTGPSGHGSPPAAGEAMALKRAGAEGVKVFAVEGEGGLTAGAWHETKNSAFGLGLDNLHYLIDWNDFGIDEVATSDVVNGNPHTWFEPYGFRVHGTEQGSDYATVTRALLETMETPNPDHAPEHDLVQDDQGPRLRRHRLQVARHAAQAQLRDVLAAPPGVRGQVRRRPGTASARPRRPMLPSMRAQFEANLKAIADTITNDDALVDYLADRLVELGDSVPEEIPGFNLDTSKNPFEDKRFWDFTNYPEDLFVKPGTNAPNRAALAKWGAWVNSFGRKHYGRPLFLAMSADLAESTNIAGFAEGYGDIQGWGRYDRDTTAMARCCRRRSPSSPTPASARASPGSTSRPIRYEDFDGFYSAHSTYASFSYLKYGLMRLFSQIAQDSDIKVGKVLWVAGHSGPETAEDSRTHFGIFSPGVMQLFPEGHVINLIPWEHNEVPVLIAAAMATDAHIVALHLTRPPIQVPDRAALGMASHFEAAQRRLSDPRLQAGPAARRHDPRAGHDVDGQHGDAAAETRRAGPERQARRGGQPRAVQAAAEGVSGVDHLPRRSTRHDLHHQWRAPPDARLGDAPAGRRVRDVLRLGQPLAHRRQPGGSLRGGAPLAGLHPQRHPALRPGARSAPQ